MKKTIVTTYQLRQRALWQKVCHIASGGTECTKEWFVYRFTQTNDSAMIAMVTLDFFKSWN